MLYKSMLRRFTVENNKMALYEINDEIAKCEIAIMESIDLETGEILDTTLTEKMKALQLDRKDKISGCIYAINKREDKIELAKKEIERLKELIKICENQDERIREYLLQNIKIGEKIDLGLHSIGWRKSEAIEIENESDIPKEYMTEKITLTPNKTKIKEAIKGGFEVKGCKLVERQNLQIK